MSEMGTAMMGDDGGAPVLEREEDHENHQEEGLEEGAVDVVDRLGDVGGHVEGNREAQALWESALDFVEELLDFLGDVEGVCAGKHGNLHYRGVAAVDSALGGIALRLEAHLGHVLEAEEGAVLVGAYDDVLELGDFREASAGDDGDCEVDAVHGRLAEDSGGRLAVLVL